MTVTPEARLAVRTLFGDKRFCNLLHDAIHRLQEEFGDTAGGTPIVLQQYFDGDILISDT